MTGLKCGANQLNRPFGESIRPAMASKEPPPIRFPPSQLFSTNLMMEVVSVVLLLTWFALVHGEITSIGSRWLYPQRTGLLPSLTGAEEQIAASSEVLEPFTIFDGLWSYQPSESS
jgi:hypothetical protein